MNHAQKYLAQAIRQIAELTVQIARQRVVVKHALDTGQGSEMAESLLDALEGSLRIFEKHRIFFSIAADHPAPCRRLTTRRSLFDARPNHVQPRARAAPDGTTDRLAGS
jgi:hypothetical protein